MDTKITSTPADEALFKFDAENNVEPTRTVAERICKRHGIGPWHSIVDEISHALEDAHDIGVKRSPYLAARSPRQ